MSFAPVGLCAPGIRTQNLDSVFKTFPTFFAELARLGRRLTAKAAGEENAVFLRTGLQKSFVFSMAAYAVSLPFQINCAATHWCMCGHVKNLSRSEWQRHADCTWIVLLPLALMGTLFIRGRKYRFYLWCFLGVFITPFLGSLVVIPALLALARLYEAPWQGSDAQQDKDRRMGV